MNIKNKVLIQSVVCLCIFTIARGSYMIDNKKMEGVRQTVKGHLEKNYTVEDISQFGSKTIEKVVGAPAAITGIIIKANQMGEFGKPIDEESEDEIKPVHATSGGDVLKSGIDKELGMFVTIGHGEKHSTYGNLCNLTVVTGDRIKKGDIIGSFNSTGEKDFYYNLSSLQNT